MDKEQVLYDYRLSEPGPQRIVRNEREVTITWSNGMITAITTEQRKKSPLRRWFGDKVTAGVYVAGAFVMGLMTAAYALEEPAGTMEVAESSAEASAEMQAMALRIHLTGLVMQEAREKDRDELCAFAAKAGVESKYCDDRIAQKAALTDE